MKTVLHSLHDVGLKIPCMAFFMFNMMALVVH